ncbi:MAG: hypothetical protein GF350_09230, partial [Chitinivibrionales bacterium]|nr:hypothetical protein [Chitinivibrionales bacterium]
MRSVRIVPILIIGFFSYNILALSGIGVMEMKGGKLIRAVRVEDNAVADSFKLAEGVCPQINTHGTHVVFWGNNPQRVRCICIVRSDIPFNSADYKTKYLLEWPVGAGYVDWPKGDWIWFA